MPQLPHSSNASSPDQLIWGMILLLATLLQLKFQVANQSPFETEFATVVASIVVTEVFCLGLCAKQKLPDYAGIIGDYAQLCGFLAVVLLVRMLEPTLGWINFSVWVCHFVTVTYRSYDKIMNRRRKPKTESNGSTNGEQIEPRSEEPNDELANDGPNGSRNEDSPDKV